MDFLTTNYTLQTQGYQNIPTTEETATKINLKKSMGELKEIGNELTNTSMFRNIGFAMARRKKKARTRETIYDERDEMFNDKSVREMVKLIIKRSNSYPFYYRIPTDTNLPENVIEQLELDFKHIVKLVEVDLLEVTIESQFLGDSYVALQPVQGRGIVNIIHNFSTKAYNVTPIVSNKGREVAYEIADSAGRYTTPKIAKTKEHFREDNRRYVEPHLVGRMNARSSGVREPTTNSLLNSDNMNAWDEERAYEDLVYGGVVEDCIESYRRFIWALNSIANARAGSAYLERFIMMHLQDTSASERKLLRDAMNSNLNTVRQKVSEKVQGKDPTISVFNYVIPTTGSEAKGSIDIQESSPTMEAIKNLEDISIHIKKFMADMGYNINLTPYGDNQEGGLEQDGFTQKSLIMEATGQQIRDSVKDYLIKIFSVHTLYKYGVIFKDIEIEFTGVVEVAQQQDEYNRVESINNATNFWGFIGDLKAQQLDDTPAIREMLIDQIEPKMERNTKDKNKSLMAIVDHVLKPEPMEGEEPPQ